MSTQDFLFELGCEELPPKSLQRLSLALCDNLQQQLHDAGISFKEAVCFATPRRLAILITELAETQPNQVIERQGPSVEKAFDKSGTPTLACIGFARSCGVSADQLQIKESGKSKRIFCRVEKTGEKTQQLLPALVSEALKKLPINKPMRWGSENKAFIRPVKWVVMLYGNEVIPCEIIGKKARQDTFGHRFHHPAAIRINQARDYETLLQTHGMVIADFNKRKHKIRQSLEVAGNAHGEAIIDERLLEEVCALVEWPVTLVGKFDREFLKVPAEALVTAMKVHQKCFPIQNQNGSLEPYFILVSNIESKNPSTVIKGNERVIHARLSDAAFFYKNDIAQSLDHFSEKLSHVMFQKSLGTLQDRNQRLITLSQDIASKLGLDKNPAKRAAELAKIDLMSEMVGEFPELQGIMGCYYAKHAGESNEVAEAIQQHYCPRFSGDQLPKSHLSSAIALADKLDLIIGIIGINKLPSGEKDPYALKRAAQGIIRILIENQLPLDINELLQYSYKTFENLPNSAVLTQTLQFILERMRFWYLDQGINAETFAAVLASGATEPLDFDQRLQAVLQFQTLPESKSLAAANKRVSNILKKSALEDASAHKINRKLFEFEIEGELADQLNQTSSQVNDLYKQANYTQALSELATLKDPVDIFFDNVLIMVDDEKVRANRLALLSELRRLFTRVADISLL